MTRATFERFTCDRCGESHDLERIADSDVWHDVTFKPRPKYSAMADGSDICPACFEDFQIWWIEGKGKKDA